MDNLTLWATAENQATADALTTSERGYDVNIVLTKTEYQAHRLAEDFEWTEAIDQLTGLRISVARAACGAGCNCAMAVRLT